MGSTALLTLQLPRAGRVVPLATTTSHEIIQAYCTEVYEDYSQREREASDEIEAAVYRAELQRLRRVFALVDPEYWLPQEKTIGADV